MARQRLHYRIGDLDDYHSCDSLDELAEDLAQCGVKALDGINPYSGPMGVGFTVDNYRGQNFVSAYWGKTVESVDAHLSPAEIAQLERMIWRINEPD